MRAVSRPKSRVDVSRSSAPLKQSLSGLASLRDQLPIGPTTTGTEAAPREATPTQTNPYTRANKLVVRRERKGHGGKTVTRIEGFGANASELEAIAKDLKRALGCGATVDANDVLVQGDQSERVLALLQARGAHKVILGS
jgi:translation initiation factor 1